MSSQRYSNSILHNVQWTCFMHRNSTCYAVDSLPKNKNGFYFKWIVLQVGTGLIALQNIHVCSSMLQYVSGIIYFTPFEIYLLILCWRHMFPESSTQHFQGNTHFKQNNECVIIESKHFNTANYTALHNVNKKRQTDCLNDWLIRFAVTAKQEIIKSFSYIQDMAE